MSIAGQTHPMALKVRWKERFETINGPLKLQSETQYQIENTQAKVILVDPTLLDTALVAAERAKFPKNRMFLFDDQQCQPSKGLKDWSTFLGDPTEAGNWWWRRLNHEEASKKLAVLNYSSGYDAY